MTRKLYEGILLLKGKNTINKMDRNIGITMLHEANVPLDKAIKLIDHRDQKSIKKYCRATVKVTN